MIINIITLSFSFLTKNKKECLKLEIMTILDFWETGGGGGEE